MSSTRGIIESISSVAISPDRNSKVLMQLAVKDLGDPIKSVLHREVARVEGRQRQWEQRLCRLEERYPSAASLRAELAPLFAREREFIARLKSASEQFAPLKERVEALLRSAAAQGASSLSFVWHLEEGFLAAGEQGPAWKRQPGEVIALDDIVRELIVEGGSAQGVGYPIIFTHQGGEDQRAVAYALGWANLLKAAQESLEQDPGLKEVRFELFRRQILLRPSRPLAIEDFPSAQDFGFSEHGEIFRRIEDFTLTDPEAHRLKWLQDPGEARREIRVLRAQTGALLQVEVDRSLRRIRFIEQPLSQVIRKRTMVFVDPSPLEVEDRYFARESELSGALDKALGERIERGYRFVYELLEDTESRRERGMRPPELLVWPPAAKVVS